MENQPLPLGVRDLIRARIEKWIDAFEKGYRQNMGLLGRAGLGKTHLLSEIHQSLCAAQPSVIPIYVDARTLDFHHFIDRIYPYKNCCRYLRRWYSIQGAVT